MSDFLETYIDERNKFEQDRTGKVDPPLPRGLVIDGPALLEAMQTPESQRALLRAAQVGCIVWDGCYTGRIEECGWWVDEWMGRICDYA